MKPDTKEKKKEDTFTHDFVENEWGEVLRKLAKK